MSKLTALSTNTDVLRLLKFEEVLLAIREHDEWLDALSDQIIFQKDIVLPVRPLIKARVLVDLYFRDLSNVSKLLEMESDEYETWLRELSLQRRRIIRYSRLSFWRRFLSKFHRADPSEKNTSNKDPKLNNLDELPSLMAHRRCEWDTKNDTFYQHALDFADELWLEIDVPFPQDIDITIENN